MKRPIMLLPLMLVMALALMGVGYGLWFEDLTIDGTVSTGSVDAEWSFVGCYDIEPKDFVGNTTGSIDADPHILHFTVDNGYPQYIGGCEVEYTVTGSVPVHVESITIQPGAGLNNCTQSYNTNTGETSLTCDELYIRWVDGLCTQLHTGDTLAASLRTTVLQPALENTQYDFDVTIQLNQYNESACP